MSTQTEDAVYELAALAQQYADEYGAMREHLKRLVETVEDYRDELSEYTLAHLDAAHSLLLKTTPGRSAAAKAHAKTAAALGETGT